MTDKKQEDYGRKTVNIARILKKAGIKPGTMTMYSPICGECAFLGITNEGNIRVEIPDGMEIQFTDDGRYFDDGEPMLFPSKTNKDWDSIIPHFSFKPFDKVLARIDGFDTWDPGFYIGENSDGSYRVCYLEHSNSDVYQCIPYEGNEHLAFTTDSFYK